MSMEQVCGPEAVPGVPSVPGSGAEISSGGGGGGTCTAQGFVVSSPACVTLAQSILGHFHHLTRGPVLVSGHSHPQSDQAKPDSCPDGLACSECP